MKRGLTKDTLCVTIDKNILKRFNEFCEKNSTNRSDWVEKRIREFLGDKK